MRSTFTNRHCPHRPQLATTLSSVAEGHRQDVGGPLLCSTEPSHFIARDQPGRLHGVALVMVPVRCSWLAALDSYCVMSTTQKRLPSGSARIT